MEAIFNLVGGNGADFFGGGSGGMMSGGAGRTMSHVTELNPVKANPRASNFLRGLAFSVFAQVAIAVINSLIHNEEDVFISMTNYGRQLCMIFHFNQAIECMQVSLLFLIIHLWNVYLISPKAESKYDDLSLIHQKNNN